MNKTIDKMNKMGVSFSNEKPVVFDRCEKEFNISWSNTIFAHDPHIHSHGKIEADVIEHELVHIKQQRDFGGVDKWWDVYFKDSKQRLEWELEAYRVQYIFLKENVIDRNRLFNYVHFWAEQLSGKSYGHLIGYREAIKEITK